MKFISLFTIFLMSCTSALRISSLETPFRKSFPVADKAEARSLIQSRIDYMAEVISQYGYPICKEHLKPGTLEEDADGNLVGMTWIFLDSDGHEFCPDSTHRQGWVLQYFCQNENTVHELKFTTPRPQAKVVLPCK